MFSFPSSKKMLSKPVFCQRMHNSRPCMYVDEKKYSMHIRLLFFAVFWVPLSTWQKFHRNGLQTEMLGMKIIYFHISKKMSTSILCDHWHVLNLCNTQHTAHRNMKINNFSFPCFYFQNSTGTISRLIYCLLYVKSNKFKHKACILLRSWYDFMLFHTSSSFSSILFVCTQHWTTHTNRMLLVIVS